MKGKSIGLIPGTTALVIIIGGLFVLGGCSGKSGSSASAPQASTSSRAKSGGFAGGSGGFAEFQKSHRYAMQLMRLVHNIGRLNEQGKAALTPAQAKSALGILEPLRKLDTLDEDSARKAVISLEGVLTDAQRTAISSLPAEPRFRTGQHQGQRPSGPPPGGAPGQMKNFNPFDPPAGGPSNQKRPENIEKLFHSLKKISEGK